MPIPKPKKQIVKLFLWKNGDLNSPYEAHIPTEYHKPELLVRVLPILDKGKQLRVWIRPGLLEGAVLLSLGEATEAFTVNSKYAGYAGRSNIPRTIDEGTVHLRPIQPGPDEQVLTRSREEQLRREFKITCKMQGVAYGGRIWIEDAPAAGTSLPSTEPTYVQEARRMIRQNQKKQSDEFIRRIRKESAELIKKYERK